MEQIHGIIKSYAGTSLTQDILEDIVDFGAMMNQQRYFYRGGMLFRVDRLCVCNDNCGGIRCKPILIFSMVGC